MFDRHFQVWPEGAPKELPLPQTSIYANLEITARRYPDKTAIVYYETEISYQRFRREADALAGYLQHLGVKKGDRVLLFMQNCPQWMIAFYGILRADAVVVPVNPMNRTAELKHYISDTQAQVAICAQELYEAIEPLVGESSLAHLVVGAYNDYIEQPTDLNLPEAVAESARTIDGANVAAWRVALNAGHEPGPHTATPDDYAVFPYSSGTTGAPKGCMHTHRSVMATVVAGSAWRATHPTGVLLSTLPLFHVTGMQGSMNGPIYYGATMVMMTRWDRDTAGKLIERYQITGWVNIATMAIDFLSNPNLDQYDISS